MKGTTIAVLAAAAIGAFLILRPKTNGGVGQPTYEQFLQPLAPGATLPGYSQVPSLLEHQGSFGAWDRKQLGPTLEDTASSIVSAFGYMPASTSTPDPMTAGGGALGQQIDPVTGVPLTGQYYPGNLVINPAIGAARMARSMMR
jgi:hypothetical protein